MSRDLEYREFEVPLRLQRLVRCAWLLRGRSRHAVVDTIYPDGCCELIVHVGQVPRWRTVDRDWKSQAKTLFAAQFRSAIQLEWKGEIDCIGLRLQPCVAGSYVDEPLAGLRDTVADLARLNPAMSRRLLAASALGHCVLAGESWWTLIDELVRIGEIDVPIETAVMKISKHRGNCSIEAIARRSCLAVRSFQYRFLDRVGLTAKEFARIMRLQATLRFLDEKTTRMAEVAADSGFADESHANRELRRVTGLTPARLRNALRSDREGDSTLRMAAAFVRGGR